MKLNIKRQIRYRQKMNFVIDKLSNIPKDIEDSLVVDAVLYRTQISIDAVMDIIAMMVKDKGKEVSDDYHNIETLSKIKFLDEKLAGDLTMLNGLRNAIVHKYNTFEEDTVINNIKKIKKIIENFFELVEDEIKTRPKSNKKGA